MALKFADDMVFLKGGAVVAAGRPDDILDEALLNSVYDIPMGLREVDGRRIVVR